MIYAYAALKEGVPMQRRAESDGRHPGPAAAAKKNASHWRQGS